jgi:hypothetical protein
MPAQDMIEVRNPNVPGAVRRVNRAKYEAVRRVLLEVLPERAPGMTQAEMMSAVRPRLPGELFPGGATGGWWTKTVQLDLEAAGAVRRVAGKPLRWLRAG